jgi:hypothetical protein
MDRSKINPLWILVIAFILFGPRIGSWVLQWFSPHKSLHAVLKFPVPEAGIVSEHTISLAIEMPCQLKVSDSAHIRVTARRTIGKRWNNAEVPAWGQDVLLTLNAPSFDKTESSDGRSN